jgi:hypothetical protein
MRQKIWTYAEDHTSVLYYMKEERQRGNVGYMKNAIVPRTYEQPINIRRHCHECKAEAFGSCPDCNRGFCLEHFPKQQHSPCAEKQMKLSHEQICYVCGTQVYPDQWSVTQTLHYIDQTKCNGCGRYICDDLHTQSKSEEMVILHEGLRGHRYYHIVRYCHLCHPFRHVGGIKRAVQSVAIIGIVVAMIFFSLHP